MATQTEVETPPARTDETAPTGERSKRATRWYSRIKRCIDLRDKLIGEWSVNVDYRRGKQFDTEQDIDRIQITTDWSATKAKQAQLFSQVPEVRLTPQSDQYAAATAMFQKKLNHSMKRARAGVAMDECLPDCINAAGVAGLLVAFESRTQMKEVPKPLPEQAAMMKAAGQPVPTESIALPLSKRFTWTRISPGDLLWPVEFTGSDFDQAPWVGYSGRCTWADGKSQFGLTDDQKEDAVGNDNRTPDRKIASNEEADRSQEPMINFNVIYYRRYFYHADEMSYEAIQHMVFVDGIDEPVKDEEWKGQRKMPDGTVAGACNYPVRFLTLTYMTDECVPPSDSAMGRPQVNELIRSRSQALKQRETSLPMRWFDVNRLDPLIQAQLLRGTWNGYIPTNGSGASAIGEVARANYPRDDYEFDRTAKMDLSETWQVNQLGGGNGTQIRSAAEANSLQANFQTRVGYERARVVGFFVGAAEVHAGLLALFGDFTPKEQQALNGAPVEKMSSYYAYDVRADASVLLDAEQRVTRLERVLNLTAKSGYINVKPIISEIVALSGIDPSQVVIDPPPPKPEAANISARVDAESIMEPMILALLMKTGQAPSPDEIEAAKKAILQARGPVGGSAQPGMAVQPSGAPAAGPSGVVGEDSNPDWQVLSRVEKRADDGSAVE